MCRIPPTFFILYRYAGPGLDLWPHLEFLSLLQQGERLAPSVYISSGIVTCLFHVQLLIYFSLLQPLSHSLPPALQSVFAWAPSVFPPSCCLILIVTPPVLKCYEVVSKAAFPWYTTTSDFRSKNFMLVAIVHHALLL